MTTKDKLRHELADYCPDELRAQGEYILRNLVHTVRDPSSSEFLVHLAALIFLDEWAESLPGRWSDTYGSVLYHIRHLPELGGKVADWDAKHRGIGGLAGWYHSRAA